MSMSKVPAKLAPSEAPGHAPVTVEHDRQAGPGVEVEGNEEDEVNAKAGKVLFRSKAADCAAAA